MARVLALIPDLLFGSRVQGALSAAGHEVILLGEERALSESLAGADLLIVDLSGELDGSELVARLIEEGLLGARSTLGFYAHVDQATRERAERAGFDLVVPRSRMAREGAALVTRLTDR